MTTSYAKLTKAELIDRLHAADARPAATWDDVRTLFLQSVSAVRREVPLFITDCYKLGQWCRNQITMVVEEMSRPILK